MCKSSVSDFCKIPGTGGSHPKTKCFSPSLQLFLQNCLLDFFSGFHLLLVIIYVAPGMGFRCPGDGPFMSGWGAGWAVAGGEWKSQTGASEDGNALGSRDVVYLNKILCLYSR